jgi:hypothetical protein
MDYLMVKTARNSPWVVCGELALQIINAHL